MTDRHRPSERLAPRPSDRIADRLHVVAAWATRTRSVVEIDGLALDGQALFAVAAAQERDETALLARFATFRELYESYTATVADRERVLFAAIAQMEQHASEPATRASLRLSRLRRPPLAKVRAVVEEARRTAGAW